jgi:threonine/homoserine/homoserine lactone efflux protein
MIEAIWVLFAVASLALIALPGRNMILVMSRSIAQGVEVLVVTAAGASIGLAGHTVLATLGLGVTLRTSEWLFVALTLLGAGYLLYLGVGLLRTRSGSLTMEAPASRPLGRPFFDGALSNLSHPKIAIFYLALLPQFVAPSAQHPTLTAFVLGLAFAGLTLLVKTPVAMFPGALSAWLRARPRVVIGILRSLRSHSRRPRCQARIRAARASADPAFNRTPCRRAGCRAAVPG